MQKDLPFQTELLAESADTQRHLAGPSFISQRQEAVADDPVELRLCLGDGWAPWGFWQMVI